LALPHAPRISGGGFRGDVYGMAVTLESAAVILAVWQ
jgi:hypothetical protein